MTARRRGPEVRTDIQGLRALAVAAVLIFHVWPGALTGGYLGVDVFFVISGFLITTHLLLTRPATGGDLAKFWMRRIRRLLPAALLVLTVTLVATRMLTPDTRWRDAGEQAIASALYVQNWHLAGESVDYLAEGDAPTAFQHYWTLSAEEQFYALWPILLLVCVLVARRLRARLELFAVVAIGAVFLGSLAFSVAYTRSDAARAFFVTPTRMWEFALGGLVAALVLAGAGVRAAGLAARVPAAARGGAVWVGFAAMVASMVVFTGDTPVPGWVTLIPTAGAALVIAANQPGGPTPNRLLAWRPLQYLGDISYSVYLWHWPLVVLVPYATGVDLRPVDQVAVVVATLALASLTKHQVEDRFRYHRARVSLAVPYRFAAVGMASVVGLAALQVAEVDRRAGDVATIEQIAAMQQAAVSSPLACFGAAVLQDGVDCPHSESDEVVPSPASAEADRPPTSRFEQCRSTPPFQEFRSCVFGPEDAKTKVALVGNSHAAHWLPALQKIAVDRNFSVTTFVADHCVATTTKLEFDTPEATRNCHAWGEYVLKRTTEQDFDLVVKSARTQKNPVAEGAAGLAQERGYARYLQRWLDVGRKVLVIRDTPLPVNTDTRPADCVGSKGPDAIDCGGDRDKWVRPDPLATAAREVAKGAKDKLASVADLTDYFCPEARCPAVIGGAMVYADPSHITATYARSLAPALEPHVLRAMGRKVEKALPGSQVSCVGAGAMAYPDRCPPGQSGPFVPSTAEAPEDYAGNGHSEGCWTESPFEQFRSCRYGPQDAERHVALVGNSHAAQWLPAVRKLAEEQGFRLTTYTASKCFPTTAAIPFGNAETTANCQAWGRWIQQQTAKTDVDLVLASAHTYKPVNSGEKIGYRDFRAGYAEYLDQWRQDGTDVLVLRDNPNPEGNVPDCVAQHRDDLAACAGSPEKWLPADPLADAAEAAPGRSISVVDMTRYFCADACPAVAGGVLVYRDHSHLTSTYVGTLTPFLEPDLLKALRRATR